MGEWREEVRKRWAQDVRYDTLTRSQFSLIRKDLRRALDAVDQLTAALRQAESEWKGQEQRAIDAEDTVADLEQDVIGYKREAAQASRRVDQLEAALRDIQSLSPNWHLASKRIASRALDALAQPAEQHEENHAS